MRTASLLTGKLCVPLLMSLVLSSTGASAGSQTEPGRTMGFEAGPVPEGLYFTNITDYGIRSTNPNTTVGVEIPDFWWSTPWRIFGANLSIEVAPTWAEVGQSNVSYVNGMFNPFGAAILGWDLGGGLRASYTIGGYVPYNSPVAGNFFTFEQKFGLTYATNGWGFTGRAIWGLPGKDQNTGLTTAPDYLNLDLTAKKTIGKWELGLIGFASTDLSKPFAGYAEQKQFALGGLVGYNFGAATLRVKATRTLVESNYGGYDTRVWTDLSFALWTPDAPTPSPRLITK